MPEDEPPSEGADDEQASDPRRAMIEALLAGGDGEVPTSRWKRLAKGAWGALRSPGLVGELLDPSGRDLSLDDVERAVAAMGEMKGVAMKTGQLLSYLELDLPEEAQAALAALRTHADPMPFERVRERLADELGDRGAALADGMDPQPVAAASIGQVHRARLPDGPDVAVKVQYPGVEEALREDFEAGELGPRLVEALAPDASTRAMHDEAREVMLAECDYRREARLQARFREMVADHDVLRVPEVFDGFSGRRVLTTRFVDAPGFEAFLDADPSQARRDEVGEALFEFYLRPLFQEGLFNADPHPGNYLFPQDGSVVVLDHGCVRSFEDGFVDGLARVSWGARHEDEGLLARGLADVGVLEDPDAGLDDEARELVELARGFYGPIAEDRVARLREADAIRARELFERRWELARLSVPPQLLFLTRIRFGLVSVLADLGAEANWFRLEDRFVEARV